MKRLLGNKARALNIILATLLLMMFTISANIAAESKATVINCGYVDAIGSDIDLAQQKFAELVEEKTKGNVIIKNFPASQLGSGVAQFEGVKMGTIGMFSDALEYGGKLIDEFNIQSMGFLFKDMDHLGRYLKSEIHMELRERLAKAHGIRIVADNWYRTPRVMFAKKPIYSIDDLKGLKMRVPDIRMYLLVWEALGTKPSRVAWGEIYLALKQGVVDAAEGPLDTIYGMKFYEAAPYVIRTDHLWTVNALFMNEKLFASLSPENQALLIEAAEEAGDWLTEHTFANTERDMEQMKKLGTKFLDIDTAPFEAKLQTLAEKLEEEGMWEKGFYNKIKDM